MSSPLPDEHPATAPSSEPSRERLTLARKWAYLLSTTAYIPLPHTEIEQRLLELVNCLYHVVVSEPFCSDPASEVGARLVALGYTGRASLHCTMDVLGKALLVQPKRGWVDRLAERVVELLAVVAAGYSEAAYLVAVEQHEGLDRAMLKTAQDAQRNVTASHTRFDAVFSHSTDGMAISDLNGVTRRANKTISAIFGYNQDEFMHLNLLDLIHTGERVLPELDSGAERIARQQKLFGKDGEPVWASVTVSRMRSSDGEPDEYLVVIADLTESRLLQNQLNHQSQHDMLTGLPNRLVFLNHVETALRSADTRTGLSLYHLGLDSFSLINNGLGRHIGDHLLTIVAQRLRTVFAEEKTMIARLDGDEFAIVVENAPTTPNVVTTVGRIFEELAEPSYLDGHGVAVSASIGVVHRPPPDTRPAELLRAADMTLRKAKRGGPRTWELFDPHADTHDQQTYRLAADMPGAWETGQIQITYRPLVRLADEQVLGIEAYLRWDHPELGTLPHDTCVKLAEQTGLIEPVRRWLLRSGCEQLPSFQQRYQHDTWLLVALTPNQSAHPELVREVLRLLDDTGLHTGQLQLGLPVQAVLSERGLAADNLHLLAEAGVGIVLDDFGCASGELACLEDLPLRTVRLANRLVTRQAPQSRQDPLITRAIQAALLTGATIIVDGITTHAQALWWHRAGCTTGQGQFFTTTPPSDTTPDTP